MAKIDKVQEVAVAQLIPYKRNAKIHSDSQVEQIAASIQEFGFLNPCLIDKNYNIIAGHGRVEACKTLGIEKVPCVFIEGLTEAQRRAYILADNRLTELGKWDMDLVFDELADLEFENFNVEVTGFELPKEADWFDKHEKFDDSKQEGNDEYNEFLDKFETKKTTDDCYTPDEIFEAVADYVCKHYNVKRKAFVRPFYPGGDYENEIYPQSCVVVDNPPFSILAEILTFYQSKGIKYFLFAPTLTLFSSSATRGGCALPCGVGVTYENGACVNTSFVTNLEDPEVQVKTCPELHQRVKEADERIRAQMKKELPKYSYPDYVITSAMVAKWSKYGIDFEVTRKESTPIDALDEQKEQGKAIFGKGFLLSERAAAERAAAERAAAERAAAERWHLSEREMEIVRGLS